jgi:RHS repeat-associated protein
MSYGAVRYLFVAMAFALVVTNADADLNWAYQLPPDARWPQQRGPRGGDPDKDCIWSTGTVIQCLSQTLAESAPVTGTSFALRYGTDRTPGRSTSLTFPLSGSDIPASLVRIELQVSVAGRQFHQTLPAQPNQSTTFTWDGKDAYGRPIRAGATATVGIGYVYGAARYGDPINDGQTSFGLPPGLFVSGNSTRQEMTLWQQNSYFVTTSLLGTIGGWSLNVHHAYIPTSSTLLLGDGPRRSTQAIFPIIQTVAGHHDAFVNTRICYEYSDPSLTAMEWTSLPTAVGSAVDGSFLVADLGSCIYRVRRDGTVVQIAAFHDISAFPDGGYAGDGGPALTALVRHPSGVAEARDGSIYIADTDNQRIRRIDPNGIITTVAGNGTAGFSGDGGPATAAQLNKPTGVAIAPDGSIYFLDLVNNRIRRIGLDGAITTIAGNGSAGFSGDGGAATQATFNVAFPNWPLGNAVSVAADGTVYFVDTGNQRVRKIRPDGIIETVAGNGTGGTCCDGGPATQATLDFPWAVAASSDGSLYILTNYFIRRVGPDGIIATVAGNGTFDFGADGGPANSAGGIINVRGLATEPDGGVLVGGNLVVRRIASGMPGFTAGEIAIPSDDGSELYEFDAGGRHLQTLNALTGTVRYQFGYDSNDRLISVTDGNGNVTTIQRDANGNPTAIIAPGGQITALVVDANGYLSTIANPAGEAINFSYTADGLLTTETDARGGIHQLTYDALGRLVRDQDPAGGVTNLSRTDTASGYQLTVTTGGGRSSTMTYEHLPTGEIRRINSDDAGAQTTVVSGPDGSIDITYADGAHTTIQQGPDPRFGMLAPVYTSITHSMPNGPTLTQTTQRTVTLSDQSNPLSLQSLTETVTVNGRTFTSLYDATSRTMTSTSPEGRQTIDIVDAQQRVVSKQLAPELTPMTATFDAQGRITHRGQGAQGFTFAYDIANRMISRVDGLGNQTTYAYDGADRISQITLPSGRSFRFAYDANGNRTQFVMPSGATHTLAYTPVDLEQSYTPPGNAPYLRSYNGDRDLLVWTLPDGRAVQSAYDVIGRDSAYTYPEATASFAYAAGDSTKRLSEATWTPASGGTAQAQAFTYIGGYVTGATWTGVAQGQFSYTYDSNFFMSMVQFAANSDNVQTALLRDREGLITGYGSFTMQRNGPAGALSQIGDGALDATLSYDALAQVTARAQSVTGQQAYQAQYAYDNAGRVTHKVETIAATSHTYDYSYDPDGQLIGISRDGGVVESYTYDANGNRISRQLAGGSVEAATFDAQDRLIQQGSTQYLFDANGSLTRRGADTFTYSARGELMRATVGDQTISYSYDAMGRRTGRTNSVGTTQYLYGDPGNAFLLTHVRDSAGVLTTLFYDEAGLLFALQRGTSRFYVASDQVGTPRVVTDSSGAVVKILQFDAFGNLMSDSNPSFDLPIAFAGGIADAVTGLVRFGFRDYDPLSGRWMARDPIKFAAGQGNLFAYVDNDPINRRDPMGLWCVGGSAYLGLGGGGSLCCHGFFHCTLCAEGGVGAGASVDVSGGNGDAPGGSVGVELKAGCGPLSVGGELTADTSGCLRAKLKGALGPVTTSGLKAKIDQENPQGPSVKTNVQVDTEAGSASVSCKVGAKARAKLCI